MRYKITCCTKDCKGRRPGCNCEEYKKQKREFAETKNICNKVKHNFCDTVCVIWGSEKHGRAKFY